jgi:hypothetical protein
VDVPESLDAPAVSAGHEADGPLAEFTALRDELLQLNQQQHQIMALQLTLVGAVFGIAISRPGLAGILMIAPIVSYSLCMRHLTNGLSIFEIARYIRDDLSDRVPGGLRWESWLLEHSRESLTYGVVIPMLLTFPGVSVVALAWTVTFPYRHGIAATIGFAVIWLISAIATVYQAVLILRIRRDQWPSRPRPGYRS